MKKLFNKKEIKNENNIIPAMDALVYDSQMKELNTNLERDKQIKTLEKIIANMEDLQKDMIWNKLCCIEKKIEMILNKQ